MRGRARIAALATVCALLLAPSAGTASAAGGPSVKLSTAQAGVGGSVTVTGTGWRARTLLMVLVCGQGTPAAGVVGGTNSCANADGRAVTTDPAGRFSRKLPVAEPPVPCPCVVHVATVTGDKAQADAAFQVAGHPVRPLPAEPAGGRLAILTDLRLDGSSGLLTWFGAPPARTLVLTIGNLGTSAVKDPVFHVGTAHGVFAPQWDEQQWRGTLAPGDKARVALPLELSAGAHGDYTVSLKYDGKVLAEQPWGVGRPWGLTVFWVLLCVVVPTAVFRLGMAAVDRLRPGRTGGRGRAGGRGRTGGSGRSEGSGRSGGRRHGTGPWRAPQLASRLRHLTRGSTTPTTPPPMTPSSAPALPWFTPETGPGQDGRLSAPHDDSPTSSPPPPDSAGWTTPTRKGPT
ncbi:hypothetical protein [Streptomyces griseoviridis]|uniref:hypothetical protein n=1 Tax=Streptomyces griseoviridis TaxID=45398 RepID=UPI00342419D4